MALNWLFPYPTLPLHAAQQASATAEDELAAEIKAMQATLAGASLPEAEAPSAPATGAEEASTALKAADEEEVAAKAAEEAAAAVKAADEAPAAVAPHEPAAAAAADTETDTETGVAAKAAQVPLQEELPAWGPADRPFTTTSWAPT